MTWLIFLVASSSHTFRLLLLCLLVLTAAKLELELLVLLLNFRYIGWIRVADILKYFGTRLVRGQLDNAGAFDLLAQVFVLSSSVLFLLAGVGLTLANAAIATASIIILAVLLLKNGYGFLVDLI